MARRDTATLAAIFGMVLSASEKQAWLSEVYVSATLMRQPVRARLSLVRDGATGTVSLQLTIPGQVIMPVQAFSMDAEDVAVWAGMEDTSTVRFTRDAAKEAKLSGYERRGELVVPAGPLPFTPNGGKLH